MSAEQRALELLGQGIAASVVASAVGVTEGRVSQLLADEEFARKVAELRFAHLTAQTQLDVKADKLEDRLLNKIEKTLDSLYKPGELLNAYRILNSAKRKGAMVPVDSATQQGRVVSITIPTVIQNKFVTSSINQVVQVMDMEGNEKSLVTASSGSLAALSERRKLEAGVSRLLEDCASKASRAELSSSHKEVTRAGPAGSAELKKAIAASRAVTSAADL